MADESWRKLEDGTWARLAWAREQRFPNKTKKEVAERLGVKPGTYNAYERAPGSSKWIDLSLEHAQAFGSVLKVRWEWLLLGAGEPWPKNDVDGPATPRDRVKQLIDEATDEQAEAAAVFFERLFRAGSRR